jgi:hypothetical protein
MQALHTIISTGTTRLSTMNADISRPPFEIVRAPLIRVRSPVLCAVAVGRGLKRNVFALQFV